MSVATAWLDAQEEWIEKAEAELHALLAAGGRVEVSWSKKHWDETQQTLVLDTEFLQNARSAWHVMVQRRWIGWLQVDAAGNYSQPKTDGTTPLSATPQKCSPKVGRFPKAVCAGHGFPSARATVFRWPPSHQAGSAQTMQTIGTIIQLSHILYLLQLLHLSHLLHFLHLSHLLHILHLSHLLHLLRSLFSYTSHTSHASHTSHTSHTTHTFHTLHTSHTSHASHTSHTSHTLHISYTP